MEGTDRFFQTEHLQQNLGHRTARGGGVVLVAQLLKFALGMILTVVLARLLTPQDYGLIGMVAIIMNLVTMFQYLGLSTATIQWPTLNHQQVTNLFWINVALSALVALGTFAASPLLAWFYSERRLIPITVAYGFILFLAGLSIQHEALMSRQMRFSTTAIIDLVAQIIGLLAAVGAAFQGAGYWAIVINYLAITISTVVGNWTACRWRPGMPRANSGIRPMLTFGGNITGYNLTTFVASNLDNVLIGRYRGPHELGLYSKAYQMLLVPVQQVTSPVGSVAIPALSTLIECPDRYRAAYLKILEKLVMIIMPSVAFMIVISDWLVLLVLGPQWTPAANIFLLLGFAALVQPVEKTTWWLLSTQGRSRDIFRWGLIGSSLAVASILTGMPWGAVGVAAAYATTNVCVTAPLLFFFVGRTGPVRTSDFYRTMAPSAAASAAGAVGLILARPHLEAIGSLAARLAVAFSLMSTVAVLVYLMLPNGRRALRNFAEVVRMVAGLNA